MFYIVFLVFAVGLLELICIGAFEGLENLFSVGTIALWAVVLCFPVYFLIFGILIRRSYRQSENTRGKTFYDFLPEQMIDEWEGKDASGRTEIKYGDLFRAFELKDALYIYLNKRQAFIVPKRDIDAQTLKRLTGFLKEKLGKKYVVC